jgi:anti-sigma factor RsiW
MSERPDNHQTGEPAGRAAHGERWNDDLAAFALDALGAAERRVVAEHLEDCEICSERLRWMLPAVDVLPATVAQRKPPPALKSRIMDVVEREAEPAAEPARRRFSGLFAGLSLRPALAGVGVFLLIAAAVTGYVLRDGGDEPANPEVVYTATAEKPSSSAHGRLVVDGDAGTLHVAGLPPTGDGQVYQAWIQDKGSVGGSVHASSVFVVSEEGVGDVAIPHGLSKARRVMITREPKGGSKHPSENSLLTAVMG